MNPAIRRRNNLPAQFEVHRLPSSTTVISFFGFRSRGILGKRGDCMKTLLAMLSTTALVVAFAAPTFAKS